MEAGRGDDIALIYDSPVTNTKRKYTYQDLLEETAKFAGVLKDLGVEKGDCVIIYKPIDFPIISRIISFVPPKILLILALA